MDIKQIQNRGALFSFEDETAVYLINGENRVYLCDTHLGPGSMDFVREYISAHHLDKKEVIVFNTHSDWDHIWGNCAFKDSVIIGHESCRERIMERGEYDLEKMPREYRMGDVKLVPPNLTFSSSLRFEQDEIEFIYAPGHTIDSSICFDTRDSVAFIGDLVEYPFPILGYEDMDAYLKTLEFIRDLPAKVKITAHSGIVEDKLIHDNIAYIRGLLSNTPLPVEYEQFQDMHEINIKRLMILKYEDTIRKKKGKIFDYISYKRKFWESLNVDFEDLKRESIQIKNKSYEQLEAAFKAYIERL